jgi:hypothetical protein
MKSLRILPSVLLASATLLCAKDHHAKNQSNPQDEIEVVAHVPLTDGAVTRFHETQHYRRNYLYVEHASQQNVTLIDVTKVNQPAVLAEMKYPSNASDNLVAVTGNAALVSENSSASATPATPQTLRIMSFADAAHPTVKQQFDGVTAMARDEQRGLIFLANADGLWILQQKYAMDPEFVKEWEHMMLDNR